MTLELPPDELERKLQELREQQLPSPLQPTAPEPIPPYWPPTTDPPPTPDDQGNKSSQFSYEIVIKLS